MDWMRLYEGDLTVFTLKLPEALVIWPLLTILQPVIIQINKQEVIIFMENQILIELPSSAAAVAI